MTPLIQTKLYIPPTRTNTVPRPRLIEQLTRGLSGKLTVISAPAGFGKTTLASAWVEQQQRPCGWLSLDEEDNDPQRFFAYMIDALQALTDQIDFVKPSASLQPKALMTMLVNDLIQLPESCLLVLDDYHLIETKAIHDALAFLCDHLPHTLHLLFISRSDPPLPLAKMRVRGELNEVREKHLRFTQEETAVFLNQVMGLNLTEENIAALDKRTEGWIASLQLAALSLRDAADVSELIANFSGTHHYVVDYLVEEVLAQRPLGTREFLLKTSILNRLSAPLCNELLQSGDAQATLEQLESANFFLIPFDKARQWYRYHHLFADVLRQRAKQRYGDQLPELYRRAARWFEANGFLPDAIEMALASGDTSFSAELILQAAETIVWEHGQWLLLDRWLGGLPQPLVKSQPRLCLYHAWGSVVHGQLATCHARLADAERVIAADPENNQLAQGELAAIRAAIGRFQGKRPLVIDQAAIALAHLPPDNKTWRMMTLVNLGAAHFLSDDQTAATTALAEVWQFSQVENQAMLGCVSASFLAQLQVRNGRYHQARQLYEKAQAMASPQQDSLFNIGMTHVGLGLIWLAWNDLAQAETYLQEGWKIGTTVQNILLILSGSLALARLRQIQGDFDTAQALILQAQAIAQNPTTTWSWVHVPSAAYLSRAWLRQGNLAEARRWLESAEAQADTQPAFWADSVKCAQAQLLMAESRWSEAQVVLDELWEAAVSYQRPQSQIEIGILQAVTWVQLQDADQARAYLEKALIVARPSGEIRLFLDGGRPIQTLMSSMQLTDVALQDYVQTILSAFPQPEPSTIQDANQQLVEPLTERELELLALVVSGTTNRDIAAQLFISYATVRRHLTNIYGKLGVNGRAQAILKAQEHQLI